MTIRDLRAKLLTLDPQALVITRRDEDEDGMGRLVFASPFTGRHITVAELLAGIEDLDPDKVLETPSRRTGIYTRVVDVGSYP